METIPLVCKANQWNGFYMRRILVAQGLKVKSVMHVFNFLHDVMLKGNGLLRNIFRKHFEEKYKHTKVALSFVLKQCFS